MVVALWQVVVASIVLVTATSAQFVGFADSVLVPAQKSLLLVFLASRDLCQVFTLTVNHVLATGVYTVDVIAWSALAVDRGQLEVV